MRSGVEAELRGRMSGGCWCNCAARAACSRTSSTKPRVGLISMKSRMRSMVGSRSSASDPRSAPRTSCVSGILPGRLRLVEIRATCRTTPGRGSPATCAGLLPWCDSTRRNRSPAPGQQRHSRRNDLDRVADDVHQPAVRVAPQHRIQPDRQHARLHQHPVGALERQVPPPACLVVLEEPVLLARPTHRRSRTRAATTHSPKYPARQGNTPTRTVRPASGKTMPRRRSRCRASWCRARRTGGSGPATACPAAARCRRAACAR